MKSPITGGGGILKKEIRDFEYRHKKVTIQFFFIYVLIPVSSLLDIRQSPLIPQSLPPIHPAAPAHLAN